MRHADIRTTMNVYGDAIPETMREVHGKVVKMAPLNKGTANKGTAGGSQGLVSN